MVICKLEVQWHIQHSHGPRFAFMKWPATTVELAPDDLPIQCNQRGIYRERDKKHPRRKSPHRHNMGNNGWAYGKNRARLRWTGKKSQRHVYKGYVKKPEIYIKAVIRSEINFWKAFGILIRRETNVSRPIKFVNIIQRSILILLQIPFITAPFVFFINQRKRETGRTAIKHCLFSLLHIFWLSACLSW